MTLELSIAKVPIQKLASRPLNFHREVIEMPSARLAFRSLLSSLSLERKEVLLPSYIGWSAREGSGVFDPVCELELNYSFYRMDGRLQIDKEHVLQQLKRGSVGAILIIHYFGYVDPSYQSIVELAKQFGVMVIEDAAHALFSDWVGHACGRLGDACIYSLHKLLPVGSGGAMVVGNSWTGKNSWGTKASGRTPVVYKYDLAAISLKRQANVRVLDAALERLHPDVEPLWGPPASGQFAQTYPVLIRRGSRDLLYQKLNEAGFGVVSLYHTMVSAIDKDRFPDSYKLASRILNLPVHQDIEPDQLMTMVECMEAMVRHQ